MTRPTSSRRTPSHVPAVAAPRADAGVGDDVALLGELVAEGVLLLDADGAVTYANAAAAYLLGASSGDAAVGRDALAALRQAGHGSAALALKGAIRSAHTRAPHPAGFTVHDPAGAPLVHGRVTARGDGTVVVLRRHESPAAASNDSHAPLDAIVRDLAAGDDGARALDQLAATARSLLGAEGACIVTLDAHGNGRVAGSAGTLAPTRGQRTELLAPPSPLRRAIDERRVVIDNDCTGRGSGAVAAGFRHVIVAPIVAGGEAAAVLCAINNGRGGFTPHDGDLAARLADHGALAVRAGQLRTAAQRGSRETQVLGDAARVLAEHGPGNGMFPALGALARETLGASGVTLTRADAATGRVERLYGEGPADAVFGTPDVTAFWNSGAGRAVRDGVPAFVNGVLVDRPTVVDRAIARSLESLEVRAFALLPFGVDGGRGVLALPFRDARPFDDAERALLGGFATCIGVAVRAESSDGARQLERARLQTAVELSRAALDAPDVATGAAALLAILDRVVPTSGKALCAHRAGESVAECVGATGSMAKLRGLRVSCPPPPPRAGADGMPEPVVVGDVRTKLGPDARGHAAAESAVMFPLVARNVVIGDLGATTALGTPLGGEGLETLRFLATPVALALDALLLAESSRVARDEQRRTDEQLRQTEKMAALGELVAGVAHEINNPLTGISAFAELLLDDHLTDEQRESARLIKREADRAVNVVRDLLAFSRKTEPTYDALELNALLERTLRLRAYALRGAGIEVSLSLADHLPLAHGDEAKLQQVVLNLLLNAEYAMRESAVRRLDASTRRVGDRLVLAIADTGSGIAPDVLPRIFEPFFTTKPAGDGTGLGLSVSYGIVQAHGGELRARSVPELGTTFEMVLPARTGAASSGSSSSRQS